MQLHTLIEWLGYSPHEAAVYLAALALAGGKGTETEIAARARLPRTTVSSVITSLHRKGLMNAYLKGRRKIWEAENPDAFLIALDEKAEALRAALPELRSLRRGRDSAALAPRAYAGVSGIKRIMADILTEKRHIWAIIPWDEWEALLGRRFLARFIAARMRQFLRIHLLAPRTPAAAALKKRDVHDLRFTQFLPDDVSLHAAYFIYGGKVAIFSLGERPSAILMEDPGISHVFRMCFESLWLRCGGAREDLD